MNDFWNRFDEAQFNGDVELPSGETISAEEATRLANPDVVVITMRINGVTRTVKADLFPEHVAPFKDQGYFVVNCVLKEFNE